MTPAAPATRTLRAPRRLPHGSAAWERADVAQWRRTVTVVAGAVGKVRGDDVTFSEEGS